MLLLALLSGCTWIDHAAWEARTDRDGDGVAGLWDCDDLDPAWQDEALWFPDTDGDGFGSAARPVTSCGPPEPGWVQDGRDCDDDEAAVNPDATEVCGGGDEDCNGMADDADPGLDLDSSTTWYPDGDEDGFGRDEGATHACRSPGPGWSSAGGDCDDADPLTRPDTLWYADADADGYGDPATAQTSCEPPPGWVRDDTDCDDARADVHPGAEEICSDGVDNDCNGDGRECRVSGSLMVEDAPIRLDGTAAHGFFGVVSTGDLDGDGDVELVVGAWGTHPGTVYLFDGPVSSASATDAARTWQEDSDNTAMGASLLTRTDFDGDGLPELAMAGAGGGTVVYGGGSLSTVLLQVDDKGEGTRALASPGDVDGDGLPDLITGTPEWNGVGLLSLWNLDRLDSSGPFSPDEARATWEGVEDEGWLGDYRSVASSMDLDGDGLADLLAAAAWGSVGTTYLIYGSTELSGQAPISDADASLSGTFVDEKLGFAVWGLGDLDEDGLDDALVFGGLSVHRLYLIRGSTERLEGDALAQDMAAATFYSEARESWFGGAAASGDVDGDGHIDLLVGKNPGVIDELSPGWAVLWYGPFGPGAHYTSEADATITSADPGDRTGCFSVALGDLDGDGLDDLIIPSSGKDDDTGSVFVLLGSGL